MPISKKIFLCSWAAAIGVLLLCCPFCIYAQVSPEGENVVSGTADFDRSQPHALTVTTPSDKLIVDWNSFNIAQAEAVHFNQPSADAIALNRVVGGDPSSIMGTLTANGRIFLINPNGIIFGPGSHVDVAGLVASTLDISNDDFLKGNYLFIKKGNAAYIINQGEIKAQPGGYICLLSQAVDNQMTIQADLGKVVLASGEKMTLALDDASAISVVIDEAVKNEALGPDGQRIDSAIKNSGSIKADGGKVILTAKVLRNVFDHAINNQGLIQAGRMVNNNGVIELLAEGADIALPSGSIYADEVKISALTDDINLGDINLNNLGNPQDRDYWGERGPTVTMTGTDNSLDIDIVTAPLPLPLLGLNKIIYGAADYLQVDENTLNVNINSDKFIAEYDKFSIPRNKKVIITQPSEESRALHRVTGNEPSQIMGTLEANGENIIINPHGIAVGPDAQVKAQGLALSTLDITNEDFLAQKYNFYKNGLAAYILNQGNILAGESGYIWLFSQAIENQGNIQADSGIVILAAGEKITLGPDDSSATVDEPVKESVFTPDGLKIGSAIKNSGTILANGGKISLAARGLKNVFDYAINNQGLIQAMALVDQGGIVTLEAEGAPVLNSGTINAATLNVQAKEADFRNDGVINAASVNIKVSGGDIINTAQAKMVADGNLDFINGGRISLEATNILQQGLISANAFTGGTAGEVVIVSEASTVLDPGSSTEARGSSLIGNGGRILINSSRGNTTVNKNAKIDVSAGTIAGNGGFVEIGAFEQLGFYGILNGRAPPGFQPGSALFDPEYASISGVIEISLTVDAWRDITIVGDVNCYSSLTLLADHKNSSEWDDEYDPGIGAIINDGDFSISAPYLILRAGSGIGTSAHPIKTNVGYLSAEINPNAPNGDIFISQGYMPLGIYDISASGRSVYVTSEGMIFDGHGIGVIALNLVMWANGGIGQYNDPLPITVTNLLAANTGSGSITIHNSGDLVILGIANDAEEGVINISGSGDIRVRYGILGNGYVTLTAQKNIYLNTIADINAPEWATVTLTAIEGKIARKNLEVEEYGLLGYWNFEEGSGYYAYDVSGNGINGIIYGNPAWVEGKFGQALYFDGTSTYVDTDRILGLGANPFTIIVWYKGNQRSDFVGLVGATPGNYHGFTMENQNGYVQNWVNDDKDLSHGFISDGFWHQIAMVRSGSLGSLYIDGQGDSLNFATSPDSVDTASHFWIGGWGNMHRLTQGAIDEVRVYKSALSGLEIAAQYIYAPGKGQIRAGSVSLNAAEGIDLQLYHVANLNAVNTGTGDIDITNDGDMAVGGASNLSGNISIQVMSSLTINGDIWTANDGLIYLSADEDIILNRGSGDFPNAIYSYVKGPNASSASITLQAGRDIYLGGPVYSVAECTDASGNGSATSGDVSLTADRFITIDGVDVYSSASVDDASLLGATAQSGAVNIIAGDTLTLRQEGEAAPSIYSSAFAHAASSAKAYSGVVTIDAYDYSFDDNNIFSEATAEVDVSGTAKAEANDVNLYSWGTMSMPGVELYSRAHATSPTDAQAIAGDISAHSYYGSVSLTSGTLESVADTYSVPDILHLTAGSIYVNAFGDIDLSGSGTGITADATALDEAYAVTGDFTLIAGGKLLITGSTDISTRAIATADSVAHAQTGEVWVWCGGNIEAHGEGWEEGEGTVSFTSWATATANYDAKAETGDITLESDNGDILLTYGYICSLAEADAGGEGDQASAASGNVVMTAGGNIDLDGISPNTRATAVGADIAQATTQNIIIQALAGYLKMVNGATVYAYGTADGISSATARSADITISSGSGDLTLDAGVSTAATASADYASATSGSIQITANSGKILTDSVSSEASATGNYSGASAESGSIELGSYGEMLLQGVDVCSKAYAETQEGLASAISHDVTLDGAGRIILHNSRVYSLAEAYSIDEINAQSGGVSIHPAGDVIISASQVYSEASGSGGGDSAILHSGDVDVSSDGSVTLECGSESSRDVPVFSSATLQEGDYTPFTAEVISGNVHINAIGDILLIPFNYSILVYSEAIASADYEAKATAGDVKLTAGGSVSFLSFPGSVAFYSDAEAYTNMGSSSASAQSGDVSIEAGEIIYLVPLDGSVSLYSAANAQADASASATSGDIYIGAGAAEPLTISGTVYSLASADSADTCKATSGDVTLESGADLIIEQDVYTSANAAADETGYATAGNINLIAGGSIPLDRDVYSSAISEGALYSQATSGDITVDAGADVDISGENSVYSYAAPSSPLVSEGIAGSIWINAGGMVILDTASIHSLAEVLDQGDGVSIVRLTSGSVSVSAGDDLTLDNAYLYSEVDAQASDEAAGTAGDITLRSLRGDILIAGSRVFSQAAAEIIDGDDFTITTATSGDISLDAFGKIQINGNPIYSSAEASDAATSQAVSGDVTLVSGLDLDIMPDIYTSAVATALDAASATSGAVKLTGGDMHITTGQEIYSLATAKASDPESTAQATSGDVTLEIGDTQIDAGSSVYSTAQAFSPYSSEASSGNVSVSAGEMTLLNAYIYSLAGLIEGQGISSSAHLTSGDVSVSASGYFDSDNSQIYSQASGSASQTIECVSGDVSIEAGSDLTLNSSTLVYSYAGSDGEGTADSASATAGEVSLLAGGKILMQYYSDVYSRADASSAREATALSKKVSFKADAIDVNDKCIYSRALAEDTLFADATSGDVVLEATGGIDVYYEPVYSLAEALATLDAYAHSGNIILTAGTDILISSSSAVYSKATAQVGEFIAQATSGDVTLDAGDTLTIDSGSALYSEATARTPSVSDGSQASSGDINFSAADYILLDNAAVYSLSALSGAGSSTSGDVVFDAGNDITLTDGAQVYSSADATSGNDGSVVTATSGDITFTARGVDPQRGDIDVDAEVYSSASASAADEAYATSGMVKFIAAQDISTNASSIYSEAAAFAGVDSMAQAVSGDLILDAGGNIEIGSESELYSTAHAFDMTESEATSGDIDITADGSVSILDSDIYSEAWVYSEGPESSIVRIASGDIFVYAGVGALTIDNSSLYSDASATGYDEIKANSGDIYLFSASAMELNGADLYSSASASSTSGDAAATAGDIWLVSGADLTVENTSLYSYAEASGMGDGLTAKATSGDINVSAGNDILIDNSDDYSIYSQAYAYDAEATTGISGGLSIMAEGDIELYSDLSANYMTIFADADKNGEGRLYIGEGVILTAYSHVFGGANEFDIHETRVNDSYAILDLGAGMMAVILRTPEESQPLQGLEITSTLEDTLILESDLTRVDCIELHSAGDLEVYGNLSAASLHLWADDNHDGYGDLIGDGQVELTGIDHTLKAAGDFYVYGDTIDYEGREGNYFSAFLTAPDGEDLGELTLESTSQDISVEGNLNRVTAAPINLCAGNDIYIYGQISSLMGGVHLLAENGSVIAVCEECDKGPDEIEYPHGPYLIAGADSSIYAGKTVASLDVPCDVLLTSGELSVIIGGESEGVSGVFTGATPSGTLTLLNTPPGIVYFNNAPIVHPPEEVPPTPPAEEFTGYILGQFAYALVIIPSAPAYGQETNLYQGNTFAGPVYLYHPLVLVDMPAAEQFMLEEGAYEFIDGQITLKGHDDLLNFFKSLKDKKADL